MSYALAVSNRKTFHACRLFLLTTVCVLSILCLSLILHFSTHSPIPTPTPVTITIQPFDPSFHLRPIYSQANPARMMTPRPTPNMCYPTYPAQNSQANPTRIPTVPRPSTVTGYPRYPPQNRPRWSYPVTNGGSQATGVVQVPPTNHSPMQAPRPGGNSIMQGPRPDFSVMHAPGGPGNSAMTSSESGRPIATQAPVVPMRPVG